MIDIAQDVEDHLEDSGEYEITSETIFFMFLDELSYHLPKDIEVTVEECTIGSVTERKAIFSRV